jgi:hypothetical protein
VIDEADKAPVEVASILKGLVEDGELLLADGRRISRHQEGPGSIKMHPDFTLWVLANRPGFPFLGNDFFLQVGDCFSTRIAPDPDLNSEINLLKSHAPNVYQNADLRRMSDHNNNNNRDLFYVMRSSRTNSQEKSTHAGGIASRVTMRPLEVRRYECFKQCKCKRQRMLVLVQRNKRNTDLHGVDKAGQEEKRKAKLKPAIVAVFKTAETLDYLDRRLFDLTLDKGLGQKSHEQTAWINVVTPTVRQAKAEADDHIRKTQRDIRDFFIRTIAVEIREQPPIPRLRDG